MNSCSAEASAGPSRGTQGFFGRTKEKVKRWKNRTFAQQEANKAAQKRYRSARCLRRRHLMLTPIQCISALPSYAPRHTGVPSLQRQCLPPVVNEGTRGQHLQHHLLLVHGLTYPFGELQGTEEGRCDTTASPS